jgi:hypothetical protein
MNKQLRDYYMQQFPEDDLGRDIHPDITFNTLYQTLHTGDPGKAYDVIGVDDSIIRERLFEKLAALLKVDYDTIYNLWMNY